MLIYILNYLSIPIYTSLLRDKRKVNLLVSIQMFLILAFRSDTLGPDLENYSNYYNIWSQYAFGKMISATRFVANHKVTCGLESGYVWLNWICAKFGLSFHGYLVVHAAICIFGMCYFLNKYAINKSLALAIIISFGTFQTFFYLLRQDMAFVVLLFVMESVKERKFFKFFSLWVLSVMFHREMIPAILIYFLYDIQITPKTFLLVLSGLGIELVAIEILYNKIIYAFLVRIGKGSYLFGDFQMNNMMVLMLLMVLCIFSLSLFETVFKDNDYRVMFWMMAIGLAFEVLSLYVPVFSRVAIAVFFPFAIVLFTDVITFCFDKYHTFIFDSALYIAAFALYLYTLRISAIVPYVSIFNQML